MADYVLQARRLCYGVQIYQGVLTVPAQSKPWYDRVHTLAQEQGRDLDADLVTLVSGFNPRGHPRWPSLT